MNVQRNTFPKNQKLKSKKAIDLLFKEGDSFAVHPIRLMFSLNQDCSETEMKVGFSVPKRNIKLAVNRNLLKRRMREAFRLNNQALKLMLKESKISLDMMFVYTAQQIHDYQLIEEKIKVILTRLIERNEVVDR